MKCHPSLLARFSIPFLVAAPLIAQQAEVAEPAPAAAEAAPVAEVENAAPVAVVLDPAFAKELENLASEDFKTREAASKALWDRGDAALEELRARLDSEDPEVALRARDLVRNIELHITPETPQVVIDLVTAYATSSTNEKLLIFDQLAEQSAHLQMLKLYSSETNQEVREKKLMQVVSVAITGAREFLQAGETELALDFLRMAPPDQSALVSLAALQRALGKDGEALALAQSEGDAALQLALHRVRGEVPEAIAAARQANQLMELAALQIFGGDPLPWMALEPAGRRGLPLNQAYEEIAPRRWNGEQIPEETFTELRSGLESRSKASRQRTITALILSGEGESVLSTLAERDKGAEDTFSFFWRLGKFDEALAIFDCDLEKGDLKAWANERFDVIQNHPDEIENEYQELISVGSACEQLGVVEQAAEAMLPGLLEIAEADSDMFQSITSAMLRMGPGRPLGAAPQLARRAVTAWAKDDPQDWQTALSFTFHETEYITNWWELLAELEPNGSQAWRYELLLKLNSSIPDPAHEVDAILAKVWDEIEQAPEDRAQSLLRLISFVVNDGPSADVPMALRAYELMTPESRNGVNRYGMANNLLSAGRWSELADQRIEALEGEDVEKIAVNHAGIAAALDRAGRAEEADEHRRLAELLYLGDPLQAGLIFLEFEAAGETEQATAWLRRALLESVPGSAYFQENLMPAYASNCFRRGDYKTAAAFSECYAWLSRNANRGNSPAILLMARTNADMAWALAHMESHRDEAVRRLAKLHSLQVMDGSIADDFFPALISSPAAAEAAEWAEKSWQVAHGWVQRYPNSQYLKNNTAWLASRSQVHLEEAEKLMESALADEPGQAAYLDTMAECQFALGRRERAVEFSRQAINAGPGQLDLLQQHYRFKSAPLPEL